MITITSEYLEDNWQVLTDNSILPTRLSEWDGGDAYTLDGIGPSPGSKVVFGAVVLGDAEARDFKIVIRLRFEPENRSGYLAPDGSYYAVSGVRVIDGADKPISVCIESVKIGIAARRRGLLESDLLKGDTVLIVGLGTGGIAVALELAKAGVGNFILIDPDRLKIGNVTRHAAGVSFVGRKKVSASRDLILEKNPFANVEVYAFEANEQHREELQALIHRSDVVVCATDGRASKLFVNKLCVAEQKTCIFGGAFRRAYGGQVIRVRPGKSACYHCFVLTMPEKESDHEVSSASNAAEIEYSDRPVAVEPGLSMDVAPIALMVTKLTVQELIIGKESTLHVLDKDFTAGWYFWVNRPEANTDYAMLPPLSDSSDEITIMRWYGVELDKESGCPTCGDFTKTLRELYNVEAGVGSISSLPKHLEV
jgi:molybdopterin/thiamine biosynthesis adenylyltransferase